MNKSAKRIIFTGGDYMNPRGLFWKKRENYKLTVVQL